MYPYRYRHNKWTYKQAQTYPNIHTLYNVHIDTPNQAEKHQYTYMDLHTQGHQKIHISTQSLQYLFPENNKDWLSHRLGRNYYYY